MGDSAAANTRALNGGPAAQVWVRWAVGLTLPALLAYMVWLTAEVYSLREKGNETSIHVQALRQSRDDIAELVKAVHSLALQMERVATISKHTADTVQRLDDESRDRGRAPAALPAR